MCINYIDLNRTYLKDSYHLSRIDQLVDVTLSHELRMFMDDFSKYNRK